MHTRSRGERVGRQPSPCTANWSAIHRSLDCEHAGRARLTHPIVRSATPPDVTSHTVSSPALSLLLLPGPSCVSVFGLFLVLNASHRAGTERT
ncbi:hypothetical protein K491DRAFT_695944 [Lophiostoma macrostomum CBS 122681]|uniref:Uncharacterized protein n=1 Tax=Lophiostoma macrostomum CBS 122681 TaxID=1314788 RepID=A0A6A6SZJ3_9PLEO|nr:hypothetical protein K491DRAFT_695944 [Lophiostoma macrostomum CBS 122681]